MRALLVVLSLLCLSTLCECQFTDTFVVNMTGYSPSYMFYSSDALFVLFQAYFWGSQPILSKIDPTSGEIMYNLTIPFTRCNPCAPQSNGLQVNENFVIITVENGTLWELFTVDIVAAEPSVVGTYTPSSPGFIRNLLQDGQNSILITEVNFPQTPTTSLITYDSTGATITVTTVPTPSVTGVEGIVYGAVNLTPNMALMCAELAYTPPYDNLITFESSSGKVEAAINAGWGYTCPIISVSTQLQGICAYYTMSSPPMQQLWCWDYSLYPSLIPPGVSAVNSQGTATAGVVDDAGNFIGCYSDNSNSYLVQYSVNYEESTYELVATAPVKQNYRCASSPYPPKQIANNRISTTLQQVATLVISPDKNGQYVSSVLMVNYGSSSKL